MANDIIKSDLQRDIYPLGSRSGGLMPWLVVTSSGHSHQPPSQQSARTLPCVVYCITPTVSLAMHHHDRAAPPTLELSLFSLSNPNPDSHARPHLVLDFFWMARLSNLTLLSLASTTLSIDRSSSYPLHTIKSCCCALSLNASCALRV